MCKEVTSSAPSTWGEANHSTIDHPLSLAIPVIGELLNMPSRPLSGDFYVPLVAGPSMGASMRFVISPEDEEHAVFNAPCGQSGHPLSRNYRDLHLEWLEGKPTPFLPGNTKESLFLIPAKNK